MSGSVATIFFGSGTFAVPVLDALADNHSLAVVCVVTAPDRPAGRGGEITSVPVATRARERGLLLLQPGGIRSPEVVAQLRTLAPSLGILADYGRLVPPQVLAIPPQGILNLHPSLLPRHRGATPIPATILAGDQLAGVTLMRMDEGLDTGPIVAAAAWPLSGAETAPELEARAAHEGVELLLASLADWLRGRLPATPQDEATATLTKPLRRSDGAIDPSRTAARLVRQVRAYQPWPGSFLETLSGRLVVWRASALPFPDGPPAAAGTLVAVGDGLALVVADALLILEEVQLAGRRRIGGAELLRGYPMLPGSAAVALR